MEALHVLTSGHMLDRLGAFGAQSEDGYFYIDLFPSLSV